MRLIDNVNKLLGDDLKECIQKGGKLQVAASCFSIYAFEALEKELASLENLEFIFTAPTFVPGKATDHFQKERREFFIPKLNRERSLYGTEFEIQLRNKLTQRAIARECAEWIWKKAVFRSNTSKTAMQNFVAVKGGETSTVYAPINGFTAVDLGYQQGDSVSNFVQCFDEPAMTQNYLQLFDQLWVSNEKLEDVTEVLCDHISSVYQENSPESIYFLILYHIFNEFLEDINEDVLPNDRTGYQDTLIWQKLYNFQRDAAVGAINKLESYNGCILADSVGLGKTFTALAVVKYYELRNRSVLVLCPKKLSDNWLNFNSNLKTNPFTKDRFNYDVLCHTDLSRDGGTSNGIPLNRVNWGNYDLVVIDESHNFRNNLAFKDRETRYQKLLNQVIRSGVKTKVLMLSATPVNNKFTDLRNQLALAYEGDSESLNRKLKTSHSVEEVFRRAQSVFNHWSKLPPEERTAQTILEALDYDFFELLDSVTIARSRKHIQTFYDMSEIGTFPERLPPVSHRCSLTDREDVPKLNEIFLQLSKLTLSVYAPLNFLLPSRISKYAELYDTVTAGGTLRQVDRERSLQALMTTNLLKRLESSVHAFRITLKTLVRKHVETLKVISAYEQNGTHADIADLSEVLEDWGGDDDAIGDEWPDELSVGKKVKIELEDMDVTGWKSDLERDQELLMDLLKEMQRILPEDDNKLQHVMEVIREKVTNPINPGNHKVLIFTAFADTAHYLYDNLAPMVQTEIGLHAGRLTGSDTPKTTLGKGHDFHTLLTLFSPRSKEKAAILPDMEGEIDLLIATDCVSEGQNLQDCDTLINFDIHWNPVRIVQRFGRIDRIGSPNQVIQLVNYWPDITLDEYINLKERVESRMVIADMSATGEDNVLSLKNNEVAYRREQLQRLQEEIIELEELKTGVSITDLGLNDFRMDLIGYVEEFGEPSRMPLGMHAVVPGEPEAGIEPGILFALRNRNDGVHVRDHNRLHPYYLVYVSHEGEILADHREVKGMLDRIRTCCKGRKEPVATLCKAFNQRTDEGRDMGEASSLLSEAIRSMVDVQEASEADSLFQAGTTSALVDSIKGLDDFELVAFLVVEQGEA